MSVIISYKGTPISNLTATSRARLETVGTYLEDNISVDYTAPWMEVESVFGANAFKSCAGITKLTGLECSGALGNYCFQSCANLTTISGFNKITSTGSSCFQDCDALVTVSGFNGVTTIADRLFNDCGALESVDGFNSLETLTDYAFYNCQKLKTVTGFASLTAIGQQAFYNCTALTTLPAEPTITSIGSQAFRSCTSLIKFEIPTNVTTLANQIFYGCSNMTDLVIHGTVNNFQPGAANNALTVNCTNLEKVTLPGGSYGSYVLYNNKKIKEMTIGGPGNPVTSIHANAFYGCNGVTCAFKVYTADGNPITHADGNFWGCNKTGSTCLFIDVNDETNYKEDYI